jgi:D-alanyl-lipoteichoic acid acyltransferase DltB (MBOAT superfamily)
MLFNSYEFLFLFLPITLLVYFLIGKRGHEAAIAWLVLASLFFYGWWNPVYLLLLVASLAVNFVFGELLSRAFAARKPRLSGLWLALGVALNLGLLAYFKYANFAVSSINALTGSSLFMETIVLPLAISFFTFQQIAYLVDAYKGITQEYKFSHYALFVTFFPQLIAGPIVHHRDMLPQFMRPGALHPGIRNISIGLSIFLLGLFKKTVLADGIAQYSTPIFDAVASGQSMTFFEAWGGALAYTFQLYFDFSGYSDMAIGAARMFGIKLPINFHSPYKATNIVEFWRRWHMTLSRFLRDYLYIPLGGSRSGKLLRYRNLMLTMLLGGLWHGAGWTFVVWGGLHGLYLSVNHAWSHLSNRLYPKPILPKRLAKLLAWLTTFIAVVIGWVFFRAASFDAAMEMLRGMAGLNGIAIPNALAVRLGGTWQMLVDLGMSSYLGGGSQFIFTWLWIAFLLMVVVAMPNTQQIMSRFEPAIHLHPADERNEIRLMTRLHSTLAWKPNVSWAVATGVIAAFGVLAMSRISEFLYFQF